MAVAVGRPAGRTRRPQGRSRQRLATRRGRVRRAGCGTRAGCRCAGGRAGVDGVVAGPGRDQRVRWGRFGDGAARGREAGQLMAPSTDKELKATLWKAANKLRGSLSASQYKDVILGLVFLKHVAASH